MIWIIAFRRISVVPIRWGCWELQSEDAVKHNPLPPSRTSHPLSCPYLLYQYHLCIMTGSNLAMIQHPDLSPSHWTIENASQMLHWCFTDASLMPHTRVPIISMAICSLDLCKKRKFHPSYAVFLFWWCLPNQHPLAIKTNLLFRLQFSSYKDKHKQMVGLTMLKCVVWRR